MGLGYAGTGVTEGMKNWWDAEEARTRVKKGREEFSEYMKDRTNRQLKRDITEDELRTIAPANRAANEAVLGILRNPELTEEEKNKILREQGTSLLTRRDRLYEQDKFQSEQVLKMAMNSDKLAAQLEMAMLRGQLYGMRSAGGGGGQGGGVGGGPGLKNPGGIASEGFNNALDNIRRVAGLNLGVAEKDGMLLDMTTGEPVSKDKFSAYQQMVNRMSSAAASSFTRGTPYYYDVLQSEVANQYKQDMGTAVAGLEKKILGEAQKEQQVSSRVQQAPASPIIQPPVRFDPLTGTLIPEQSQVPAGLPSLENIQKPWSLPAYTPTAPDYRW